MNLNELLKKLSGDTAFAANYEGLELDAWVEQAKKDGYEVTAQEVQAYLANTRTGELSDDELDAASGGCVLGPSVIQLPYLPIEQPIPIEPLPAVTGGPVTVQKLPFTGNNIGTTRTTSGQTFSI